MPGHHTAFVLAAAVVRSSAKKDLSVPPVRTASALSVASDFVVVEKEEFVLVVDHTG